MRDITLEDTFEFGFSTRAFATGIPTVLAGTPALSVKEGGNDTLITAGVSVDVDTGSPAVVGLNEGTIVATAANGYEAGKSYYVYISTGTVGGVSVVGEVVHEFTIAASAAAVDLANGTDGLGALKAETALIVADTGELQADDTPTAIAAVQAVVDKIPLSDGAVSWNATALGAINAECDTAVAALATTADLLDKLGAVDEAAAAGDPSATESVMQYVKQIVNVLTGSAGIVSILPAAAPASGVSLAEMIRAIYDDSNELQGDWVDAGRLDTILDAIPTATMRGTDSAALASVATEGRLSELDAANLPADVDNILTDTGTTIPGTITTLQADTDDIQTRLPAALAGGLMSSDLTAVSTSTAAADNLKAHALETLSVTFTTSGGSATTAVLNLVDGAAASTTNDVYVGRILIFNAGTLDHQVTEITAYVGATKTATITAITTAPTSAHTARMV